MADHAIEERVAPRGAGAQNGSSRSDKLAALAVWGAFAASYGAVFALQ